MKLTGKRFLFRLGLILLGVLIPLAGAEIAFRVAGIGPIQLAPRMDQVIPPPDGSDKRAPFGFVPYSAVRSTYDGDPRGYFDPGGSIDHVFNAEGWRDADHQLRKPPDTYRILGLGDSYLMGQGVRPEDICLRKLEGIINSSGPPRRVEAINAGISRLSTVHELALLRGRGLAYSPDLVILHFCLNDAEPDITSDKPKLEFFTEYIGSYIEPKPGWLSRSSRVWGWARQRLMRAVRGRSYIRSSVDGFLKDRPKWDACAKALLGIRDACKKSNVRLLVVIFPFFHKLNGAYPFQPIHDKVRSFCEAEGMPVLDLRDAYRDFSGPELWVHPTDPHPNEKAHAIAARAIADRLRADNPAYSIFKK